MKRKIFIAFAAVVAVFAAALAFAGCANNDVDDPPSAAEYVVVSDGCGKNYTLRGGEEITAFYEYDAEKVLNFTKTYYSVATGEVTDESSELMQFKCNKPIVYAYTAFPLNADGEREECHINVIVSAQELTEALTLGGHSVKSYVYGEVGATYTFVPPTSGQYTFSCTPENGDDEFELTVCDRSGKTVDLKGALQKGWTYFVHVTANISDGSSVLAETAVEFTPPLVNEGENEVTLTNCNWFEFTPAQSGVYTAVADNNHFDFYDGETGDKLNINGYSDDAPLVAGKKYFMQNGVGYENPLATTLTVKRVDRAFEAGAERQLNWKESYIITAEKYSNYHFKFEVNNYGGAAEFCIYGDNGYIEKSFPLIDSGEFNVLLGAGKHYVNVNSDCKGVWSYAPKNLTVEKAVFAMSGEVINFTAPISCNYKIDSWYAENTQVEIYGENGEQIDGTYLTAGKSYGIVADFGDNRQSFGLSAEPVTVGTLNLGEKSTVTAGELYAFEPPLSGRYKFAGADGLEIYDEKCAAVETDGDTVSLVAESLLVETTYYAVVAAATTTAELQVLYYPYAIPVAEGVKIVAPNNPVNYLNYNRFELSAASSVELQVEHEHALTCRFLDAKLNKIEEFALTEDEKVSTVAYDFAEGGVYYLYWESGSGSTPTISFKSLPANLAGEFVLEKGATYVSEAGGEYKLGELPEKSTVRIKVYINMRDVNLFDRVNLVSGVGGDELSRFAAGADVGLHETTLIFNTRGNGVYAYYIKVFGKLKFEVLR